MVVPRKKYGILGKDKEQCMIVYKFVVDKQIAIIQSIFFFIL